MPQTRKFVIWIIGVVHSIGVKSGHCVRNTSGTEDGPQARLPCPSGLAIDKE